MAKSKRFYGEASKVGSLVRLVANPTALPTEQVASPSRHWPHGLTNAVPLKVTEAAGCRGISAAVGELCVGHMEA